MANELKQLFFKCMNHYCKVLFIFILEQGFVIIINGLRIFTANCYAMKKINTFFGLYLLFSMLYSCGENPPKPVVKTVSANPVKKATVASEVKASEPVLAQYMRIKNAMIADDSLETKSHIKAFPSILTVASSEQSDPQAKALINNMQGTVQEMQDSPFEQQRFQLITLTQSLIAWQEIAPSKEPIYVQYCPMYKGGNSWLSMEEQVLNPYYGSKMLRCGVVEKKLN